MPFKTLLIMIIIIYSAFVSVQDKILFLKLYLIYSTAYVAKWVVSTCCVANV